MFHYPGIYRVYEWLCIFFADSWKVAVVVVVGGSSSLKIRAVIFHKMSRVKGEQLDSHSVTPPDSEPRKPIGIQGMAVEPRSPDCEHIQLLRIILKHDFSGDQEDQVSRFTSVPHGCWDFLNMFSLIAIFKPQCNAIEKWGAIERSFLHSVVLGPVKSNEPCITCTWCHPRITRSFCILDRLSQKTSRCHVIVSSPLKVVLI